MKLSSQLLKFIDPEQQKFRVITLCTGLLIYFMIFYFVQQFKDSAVLFGDEWEYQSMAVNLAKGYGLQLHGGLANFEDYKFLEGSNDYVATYTKQHNPDFYRTPLYPMFLGTIYKIFGISPYIAKIIQLLLIVFVGAYLPLLGYSFWGKRGFYSGIISTPVFIATNYKMAGSILTEPLIVFIILIVLLAFMTHQRKNKIKSALLLGFVLGLSWLTKGILMPLTLFLFGYYAWKFYKSKNRQLLTNLAVMVSMFLITLLPYIIFVNAHSKDFIFISNQGKAMMLDSHNEFVKYGFWGWQRQTDPKSFYLNDNMQNAPNLKRIVNFYMHYPELIFKLIKEKLASGFLVLSFCWLLILCMLADHLRLIIERFVKKRFIRSLYGFFSLAMILFGFIMVLIRLKDQLYFLNTGIYKWLDIMNIIIIPLGLVLIILVIWNFRKPKAITIPFIMTAVILNFMFMVAATCVPILDTRFVKVIDFVFILISVHYFITYTTTITTPEKPITYAV